jgi:hypothetical protein
MRFPVRYPYRIQLKMRVLAAKRTKRPDLQGEEPAVSKRAVPTKAHLYDAATPIPERSSFVNVPCPGVIY